MRSRPGPTPCHAAAACPSPHLLCSSPQHGHAGTEPHASRGRSILPILGAASCPSPLPTHPGDRAAAPGRSREGERRRGVIAPSLRHSPGLPGPGEVQPARGTLAFQQIYVCNMWPGSGFGGRSSDALGTGGHGRQDGTRPRDLALPNPARALPARVRKPPHLHPCQSPPPWGPVRGWVSRGARCVPPDDTRCRARGTPRAWRPALPRRDVQDEPFTTHSTSLTSRAQRGLAAPHPWPLITHFCSH